MPWSLQETTGLRVAYLLSAFASLGEGHFGCCTCFRTRRGTRNLAVRAFVITPSITTLAIGVHITVAGVDDSQTGEGIGKLITPAHVSAGSGNMDRRQVCCGVGRRAEPQFMVMLQQAEASFYGARAVKRCGLKRQALVRYSFTRQTWRALVNAL